VRNSLPVSRPADPVRSLPVGWVTAALTIFVVLIALAPVTALAEVPERRVEVNAMEYPWSTIGRVNTAGRGHCTGFLIGERQVITAAHCLYDAVVGRWLGAIELHFIAGYQRDRFILHSKVASYTRPENFTYSSNPNLEFAANDWAVLTLVKPLGRQAGWLGVKAIDSLMLSRISAGDALLLQAGYRRDRAHVMTAGWSCQIAMIAQRGRILVHDCNVIQGDSGSPLLLYADGKFYAVGLHSIDLETPEDKRLAGVLSLGIFHPSSGTADAVNALSNTTVRWVSGQLPSADSAAARVPVTTIDNLLAKLGYLRLSSRTTSIRARSRALTRFQSENGLASSGTPSIEIMGHLLHATAP